MCKTMTVQIKLLGKVTNFAPCSLQVLYSQDNNSSWPQGFFCEIPSNKGSLIWEITKGAQGGDVRKEGENWETTLEKGHFQVISTKSE